MKKKLSVVVLLGLLAFTSISVLATEKTPLSVGEDVEITDTFVRPCGRDEACESYGACGDYTNCANRPEGGRQLRMSGQGNGYGNGQGRGCCR